MLLLLGQVDAPKLGLCEPADVGVAVNILESANGQKWSVGAVW
jgi:hypothetical protein